MGTPELPVPDGLVLRPFRGVRFAVDDPARVTSPPYDLISDSDVDDLLSSHPNNVVRLILPYGTPGTSAERYGEARDTLQSWLAAGILKADPTPALYVYEQEGPGVLQRGLIGDVGLADPADRVILPHEDVLPGPVADRLALMSTTQANLEPIFLLYDGSNGPLRRSDVAGEEFDQGVGVAVLQRLGEGVSDPTNAESGTSARPASTPTQPITQPTPEPTQTQAPTPGTPPGTPYPPHPGTPNPGTPPHPGTPNPGTPHPGTPHTGTVEPAPSEPTGTATALVNAVAGTREPLVDLRTTDGLRHRLWAITDPAEIAAINTDLRHRQALIADGHHRYATYRVLQRQEHDATGRPGPWDYGLALLVDSSAYPPDLKPIHRVVPGIPLADALARAKPIWHIQDHPTLAAALTALAAAAEPAFLLASPDGYHLLTNPDAQALADAMPETRSPQWRALNTSVLTEFVLPEVFGIRDSEETVRIVHHNAEAAVRLATRTGGTAVILRPLEVEAVLAVAAEGERVPRKSTSFGPKPRTGLVLRTFAID